MTGNQKIAHLRRKTYDLLEVGHFAGPAAAWVERFLVFLIILNVLAVILETVETLALNYSEIFWWIEAVSVSIFIVEYLARLWVSVEHSPNGDVPAWRARLKFIRSPLAIIDIVAILPFFLVVWGGEWRILRLFRLIRLFRLVRYSPALASLGRVLYSERHVLLAALIIMAGVLLSSATVLYLIEGSRPDGAFATIPDSLWWALTTLTTVGYGDMVPATGAGKVAGGLVMIFGLAFYGLPIGILASGFVDELKRHHFVVPLSVLKSMPVFEGLGDDTLRDVAARLRSVSVADGTILVHRREADVGLYLVIAGEVTLFVGRQSVRFDRGKFFGCYGPLYDGIHPAGAVAHGSVRLLRLAQRDLELLLSLYPELRQSTITAAQDHINELEEQKDITSDVADNGRNNLAQLQ